MRVIRVKGHSHPPSKQVVTPLCEYFEARTRVDLVERHTVGPDVCRSNSNGVNTLTRVNHRLQPQNERLGHSDIPI